MLWISQKLSSVPCPLKFDKNSPKLLKVPFFQKNIIMAPVLQKKKEKFLVLPLLPNTVSTSKLPHTLYAEKEHLAQWHGQNFSQKGHCRSVGSVLPFLSKFKKFWTSSYICSLVFPLITSPPIYSVIVFKQKLVWASYDLKRDKLLISYQKDLHSDPSGKSLESFTALCFFNFFHLQIFCQVVAVIGWIISSATECWMGSSEVRRCAKSVETVPEVQRKFIPRKVKSKMDTAVSARVKPINEEIFGENPVVNICMCGYLLWIWVTTVDSFLLFVDTVGSVSIFLDPVIVASADST